MCAGNMDMILPGFVHSTLMEVWLTVEAATEGASVGVPPYDVTSSEGSDVTWP